MSGSTSQQDDGRTEESAVAIRPNDDRSPQARPPLTAEQKALIKRTVARGATDDELNLFLYVCTRTGLDPLTRQIHFVKRKLWNPTLEKYDEVGVHQTGIDGLRVIAERSGQYAGQGETLYAYDKQGKLLSATAQVYRKDHERPTTVTAFFDEYAQRKPDGTLTVMWTRMPHVMLAKCAEGLALRKAFPQDLAGIYSHEEMMQADNGTAAAAGPTAAADAPAAPIREFPQIFSRSGDKRNWTMWWPVVRAAARGAKVDEHAYLSTIIGRDVKSAKDLSEAEYTELYARSLPPEAAPSVPSPGVETVISTDPNARPGENTWEACEECGEAVPPEVAKESFKEVGRVLCGPHMVKAQAGAL